MKKALCPLNQFKPCKKCCRLFDTISGNCSLTIEGLSLAFYNAMNDYSEDNTRFYPVDPFRNMPMEEDS